MKKGEFFYCLNLVFQDIISNSLSINLLYCPLLPRSCVSVNYFFSFLQQNAVILLRNEKKLENPWTVFKVLGYVNSIGVCGPRRSLNIIDSIRKKQAYRMSQKQFKQHLVYMKEA